MDISGRLLAKFMSDQCDTYWGRLPTLDGVMQSVAEACARGRFNLHWDAPLGEYGPTTEIKMHIWKDAIVYPVVNLFAINILEGGLGYVLDMLQHTVGEEIYGQ